ncbi:uncharacterized protein C8Q71DRAFT_282327 [Rhodofomes roseus]|uniref:Uncharacterized protein n=1 Tax=Rhodofomes roseus TaxID=34475 RepID=A0ABQ8K5B3_9APHY|nr:uncharacterized protein C8Q71DRAFT_282327 [Rhodofomes roseus]KAH9831704.1 hypothetical protein C8Q71DRAFT_282327 [Rhodofomes roseus]
MDALLNSLLSASKRTPGGRHPEESNAASSEWSHQLCRAMDRPSLKTRYYHGTVWGYKRYAPGVNIPSSTRDEPTLHVRLLTIPLAWDIQDLAPPGGLLRLVLAHPLRLLRRAPRALAQPHARLVYMRNMQVHAVLLSTRQRPTTSLATYTVILVHILRIPPT